MLRRARRRVLGVLAGRDMEPDRLRSWAFSADVIYAADGGADRLLEAGVHAHVAVGDFDSISAEARGATPDARLDPDQERTDCDKLLSAIAAGGDDEATLACIEGDRIDHVLATLSSALACKIRVRLALRQGLGIVMRAGHRVEVQTEPGRLVSLMPLLPCRVAWLEGVHWPLRGEPIAPGGRVSISNFAEGRRVGAVLEDGAAVLVVERMIEEEPDWPAEPEWR